MIQTRSEVDGILEFCNMKDAYEYAMQNSHVWKISFTLPNGERVRWVKHGSYDYVGWNYEPIEIPDK